MTLPETEEERNSFPITEEEMKPVPETLTGDDIKLALEIPIVAEQHEPEEEKEKPLPPPPPPPQDVPLLSPRSNLARSIVDRIMPNIANKKILKSIKPSDVVKLDKKLFRLVYSSLFL